MATIIVENEIQDSPQQPRNDGESGEKTAVEMSMAARFGEMTESNRQLQEKLAKLEMDYERAVNSGQASQAQISALERRIDELIAKLEEPEEENTGTEMVTPPQSTPEPITDEPKKANRSTLHKILFG